MPRARPLPGLPALRVSQWHDRRTSGMMEEATGHPGAEARQAGPRHAGFWEERTQGMRILAFGGSLRAGSLNRALLHEAVALMPPHSELDMSQLGVAGSLPLFNSDLVGD